MMTPLAAGKVTSAMPMANAVRPTRRLSAVDPILRAASQGPMAPGPLARRGDRLRTGSGRRHRRRRSFLGGLQPTGLNRCRERLIVQIVLVCVTGREVGDGPIESLPVAEVGRDGNRVSRARVGACERPAAD